MVTATQQHEIDEIYIYEIFAGRDFGDHRPMPRKPGGTIANQTTRSSSERAWDGPLAPDSEGCRERVAALDTYTLTIEN